MDALLEQVDVPLPEGIVAEQFDSAMHGAIDSVNHDEAKFAEVLAEQGKTREEFETETRTAVEKDVQRQLLFDALADELGVQVGQDDLTERLVATSRQYGIEPQQLFSYLQENNQLPAMFADVRRGLAIAAVVAKATVTDTDGNTIDTSEFFPDRTKNDADAQDATDAATDADDTAEESSEE